METFSRRPARFVKASPKCRKRVAGFVDDMLPDHLPFGNQKRFWRDFERGPQGVIFRSQIGGVIVQL